MPESSQVNSLPDTGRYRRTVLTPRFLLPVGRMHRHDDVE